MATGLGQDERTLVDALTGEDQAAAAGALVQLMHGYKGLVYGIALELTNDRSLADDVFQETFVRLTVWLREKRPPSVSSFPRLLSAFVRRIALELGRGRRSGEVELEDELLQETSRPISLIDALYAHEILDSLSEPARGVVEQTVLKGMTSREAAEVLNMSPQRVRVIKHRTLRKIREQERLDVATLDL